MVDSSLDRDGRATLLLYARQKSGSLARYLTVLAEQGPGAALRIPVDEVLVRAVVVELNSIGATKVAYYVRAAVNRF